MIKYQQPKQHTTNMADHRKTNDCKFYCNRCSNPLKLFQQANESVSSARSLVPRSSLTNCSHILCNACRPKCAENQIPVCPVCRANCRMIYITHDMPEHLRLRFMPLSASMKMLSKNRKFQRDQQNLIFSNMSKTSSKYEMKLLEKQQEKNLLHQTALAEHEERKKFKNIIAALQREKGRYDLLRSS